MERRNGGLLFIAASGALLTIGLLFLVWKTKKNQALAPATSQPPVSVDSWSAGSQGETWTHRELLQHLNSRGVRLESFVATSGAANGPAMYFVVDPDERVRGYYANGGPPWTGPFIGTVVYVQKRTTPGEARDQAGLTRRGFSWGRFLFLSNSDDLDRRIRTALP